MVTAVLLSIGNEILEGSIVDTNATHISQKLSRLGITVTEIRAVPDDLKLLIEIFKQVGNTCDLILTTGGLGPTFDDITAEAMAAASGQDFVFNQIAYDHIESCLSARGVGIKETHKRQAYLPGSVTLFPNEKGTAYGFGTKLSKAFVIAMPGIPYEMKHMLEHHIIPHISKRFDIPNKFFEELRFTGIPESDLDEAITSLKLSTDIDCIINVSSGEIIVRLRSLNKPLLQSAAVQMKEVLNDFFIGYRNCTLEANLIALMTNDSLTLTVAESCTGGLIGSKITSVSGSSSVFSGGFLTYSNESKMELIDVDETILINHGAVSKECAEAMAFGAQRKMGTNAAISVTGIAGPDGGTDDKPVGLVYFGIALGDSVKSYKFNFNGDRNSIRERSAKTALNLMLKTIIKNR